MSKCIFGALSVLIPWSRQRYKTTHSPSHSLSLALTSLSWTRTGRRVDWVENERINKRMNAANENHIKLLQRPSSGPGAELELDSLKLSIDKADKELTRERAALRKFQRSIQSVQKCKTAEVEAETMLAEQLSLYIAYNSEINIIKSLELFQSSINELSRLRQINADTLKELFFQPVDDLLKSGLKKEAHESLNREWANAVDDYETKVKRIRKGLDQGGSSEHEQLVLKRTATDYFIKRNQVSFLDYTESGRELVSWQS